MSSTNISVVIPTYRRAEVLLDTIRYLLELPVRPDEILIVDQTEEHLPETLAVFQALEQKAAGLGTTDSVYSMGLDLSSAENVLQTTRFRRIVLPKPSIPRAMNLGLLEARGDIVLFLDDDLIPDEQLVSAHLKAHEEHPEAAAVAGQVLQPEDGFQVVEGSGRRSGAVDPATSFGKHLRQRIPNKEPRKADLRSDLSFKFNSTEPAWVENVMAGNLSVKKEFALRVGGFDENFIPPVSFRFETEFARRLLAEGGRIRFEPRASIKHLRAGSGGTRTDGRHLTSASPVHGVGDYYYALRCGRGRAQVKYILNRPFREVRTKFHVTHPWYIPVKFIGELRAIRQAFRLNHTGPKPLKRGERSS
jgi:GT2 family glycosyltransferase